VFVYIIRAQSGANKKDLQKRPFLFYNKHVDPRARLI